MTPEPPPDRQTGGGELRRVAEKITDLLMNRFDAITQDVLRAIAPVGDDPRHLVIDGYLGAERED